jgi:outer membrane protein OmpA-like peptidoglycan-associated protein
LGQVIGKDTKGTLTGAAIGAAIGGLAGAGIGHALDQQENAFRNALMQSDAASVRRTENAIALTFKSDFLFSTGSSMLHPGAYSEMDRVARVLSQHPHSRIRIEGFTDSEGTENSNLRLSQQRADAVKNALISRGVAPERMSAIGYGEDRPIASNATPEGRQHNRRVEIYVEPTA